jgi:hypothetical protein
MHNSAAAIARKQIVPRAWFFKRVDLEIWTVWSMPYVAIQPSYSAPRLAEKKKGMAAEATMPAFQVSG